MDTHITRSSIAGIPVPTLLDENQTLHQQNEYQDTPPTTSNSNKNNNNKYDLDTSKLYVSKTTNELLFTYLILKACSFPIISNNGQFLFDLSKKLGLSLPVNFFVKHTFFKQFCAGETIKETETFSKKLNKLGIGSILDYSIEESDIDGSGYDSVANVIIETVKIAAQNPTLSFSCVKFTGLVSPSILERLNQLVSSVSVDVTNLPEVAIKNPIQFYKDILASNSEFKSIYTSDEIRQLEEFVNRAERIFIECNKYGVPILLDAEQSYYQVAIHQLAMAFSYKYNREKPIIYNTYQMYLVQGMDILKQHLEMSKKLNFKLGAKIVRGAYMVTESERANKLHYENPIQPTLQDTHNNYNGAVDFLLREIRNDKDSMGLMIASHNEDSVKLGTRLIKEYGIDPSNPNVQFGQLFGMADFLTNSIVAQKQRVFKYVPFGPVNEVLPYLVRRMHENKGFVGSNSEKELYYLKKEISRRIFGSK
ncbi:hypothetical protein DICPUDRAFT_37322 [Dictyostelium purpureum]|uniref:Proline dehydrogenase n=1 Tax=Dictyostelium purpureum TaxID=5786 RepID=F0ZSP4_DICPU|nr:uncharacterized protein DICPUDRAFT_37322 [Dictyostelium purpureum]EGC33044.1 hypothetical protein DICPUDRAFT_37322 [Dictyostelium purpureum]|eukprot:XP_003290433.1 hypothetical protein DICPUDRAFT_37322 [Dictyostelium purpureum]